MVQAPSHRSMRTFRQRQPSVFVLARFEHTPRSLHRPGQSSRGNAYAMSSGWVQGSQKAHSMTASSLATGRAHGLGTATTHAVALHDV